MLKCQLAKVYVKDKTPQSKTGYYITEKLDGNRCIAEYNGDKWTFTSRNEKPLAVSFDLSSFDVLSYKGVMCVLFSLSLYNIQSQSIGFKCLCFLIFNAFISFLPPFQCLMPLISVYNR